MASLDELRMALALSSIVESRVNLPRNSHGIQSLHTHTVMGQWKYVKLESFRCCHNSCDMTAAVTRLLSNSHYMTAAVTTAMTSQLL